MRADHRRGSHVAKRCLVIAVTTAGLLGSGTLASADPGPGAEVLIGGRDLPGVFCSIAAQFTGVGFQLNTLDWVSVVTPAGTSVLTCNFHYPTGLEPVKTFTLVNFGLCGTFGGGTTDVRYTATVGGTGTLICKITGSA
jgi:hypothetical protein